LGVKVAADYGYQPWFEHESEAAAKTEVHRLAAEAATKAEADRLAAEAAAQAKVDRSAAEAAAKTEDAKAEADRLAAGADAKAEADRIAAEADAKAEADRPAAGAATQEEADRIAAEADAGKPTWQEVGYGLACDNTAGEVSLPSPGKVSLGDCQKACEDLDQCKSITFWPSKWCSHFSTTCDNLVTLSGATAVRISS